MGETSGNTTLFYLETYREFIYIKDEYGKGSIKRRQEKKP